MINGSLIVPVPVRAQCTCELLSTYLRPFLWSVHVWGDLPHAYHRLYEIKAPTEREAAQAGIRRFEFEMAMKARH